MYNVRIPVSVLRESSQVSEFMVDLACVNGVIPLNARFGLGKTVSSSSLWTGDLYKSKFGLACEGGMAALT